MGNAPETEKLGKLDRRMLRLLEGFQPMRPSLLAGVSVTQSLPDNSQHSATAREACDDHMLVYF